MMSRNRQSGLAMVEFAIVASVLLMLIIAVLEMGRASFVFATMDEVTRRGARLAAVCPVNDPAIPRLAVFNDATNAGTSSLVAGLEPGNVIIEYLDQNGAVVANPLVPESFLQIRYVRARVVDFEHTMHIPFVSALTTFTLPEFATVLPRESLGVPRQGVIQAC